MVLPMYRMVGRLGLIDQTFVDTSIPVSLLM